ncbi:LysR family transcriptional regulator [Desulfurivibrio sp. C05AmB]|uniref:LysR family transcriptional regulator n=1 Tax=Desulfurivibrio sp. C05AmB TaxID=3374371 RepID=UPI00376F0D0B
MTITLRQLEIFVAVAENGQVTKASSKLHLTQSAVSMALNELQNQLAGSLFDRRGHRLLINDRGRYLLPIAKNILSQVNNIEALLSEQGENVAGSLKIAASSTIGNYVLPYFIGVFKKLYPAVFLNMEVCNTRQAEKLIVEGVVDLGFVEGEVSHDQVKTIPWLRDELVVIAAPTHPMAEKTTFEVPADLNRCQWIMREKGSGTAQVFKKKLGDNVTGLQVAMELGHTEAIKKAVESGAGVACLSSLTICRELEEGRLTSLRVEGLDMGRTLHTIHYRHKAMTGLMRAFVNFCSLVKESNPGCACLTSPRKLRELLLARNPPGSQTNS